MPSKEEMLGKVVAELVQNADDVLGVFYDITCKFESDRRIVMDGRHKPLVGWIDQLKRYARGETCWMNLDAIQDPFVRINYTRLIQYPEWVKRVEFPDLESVGRSEYNLTRVRSKAIEPAEAVIRVLNSENLLTSCLCLHDLFEIQKKRIHFYHQVFGREIVTAWRSVVRDKHDALRVPYLRVQQGQVTLQWGWGFDFVHLYPAE